jgi:hypothetical protein
MGLAWKTLVTLALLGTVPGATTSHTQPSAPKAPGAKPAFEFRSHRIGDRIEGKYPNWQQGKPELFKPGCDTKESGIGVISCDDRESYEMLRPSMFGPEIGIQKIGDIPIMQLSYSFFEGRLYSVDMAFGIKFYPEIRDMLIGKYGKPARVQTQNIQNRAGATFENVMSEWEFREGTLKLNMRFAKIDTSWLTFENPSVERQIQARKAAVGAERGKRAF